MGNLLILLFLGLLMGTAAAIVLFACRIIIGWVLPAAAVAKIDAGAKRTFLAIDKIMTLFGKLILIGVAALICWFVYLVVTGTSSPS
jgi:hypothetical protein